MNHVEPTPGLHRPGEFDPIPYEGLDPRADQALQVASLHWHDEAVAERWLRDAESIAPTHLAVVVAHYRYHFYKHHFDKASDYATKCLSLAAKALGLPVDYREVDVSHADFTAFHPHIRFWLFTMQAYGYVLLRCGRHDEGLSVLRKIVELDGRDQTRTRILLHVVTRPQDDEHD